MKYIDSEKLIAEIERCKNQTGRRLDNIVPIKRKDTMDEEQLAKIELRDNVDKAYLNGVLITLGDILSFITSLQQEQPLTIEKVVEQCKRFGGNPEVIQQEQKCIFGNIPGEDICLVCSAACPLRVPKTKVSTSTEIAAPSRQVENLTFEEYLRGVFEINNGIENDPDNLVRIHAPELLKLARKQEQPKADLEKEIQTWCHNPLYELTEEQDASEAPVKVLISDIEDTARHFYEFGQRTKYQQDRAEFAKLKTKEWQEGYDEGYGEGYAEGLNARKEE